MMLQMFLDHLPIQVDQLVMPIFDKLVNLNFISFFFLTFALIMIYVYMYLFRRKN
uniref:Uncharacterized protein n=1 Tax=Manihot esculenta TaxID=3983 RepID=A0A199UCM7_MANES